MNYRSLVLLCALGCAPGVELEADVPVSGDDTTEKEQALLNAAQLDQLLSPVALYPDPLIAVILPASTFPADVVLAARYLNGGGTPEAIEAQQWDDSVKALARYPEIVKWMDENLAWTRQVGAAFALQPADVLTCTQRLRAAARAAGNLATTAEQTVIVERQTIRIVPAQPEVIYVPVYDPACVYRPRIVDVYYPRPLIVFSSGYRTGFWLSFHCNWNYNTVVVIGRPYRAVVWQTYPRWSCPAPSSAYDHHVWRPAPVQVRAVLREQAQRPREWSAPTVSLPRVQREPARENARPGAALPSGGELRPARPTVAPSSDLADTNTAAASANPITRRPSRFSDSVRPTQPPPQASTVSSDPSRGGREQGNRHSQNIPSPSPSQVASVPSPSPALSPVVPTVTPGAGPTMDTPRRIQFPTTRSASDATSEARSRLSNPSRPGRLSAPMTDAPAPAAAPRPARDVQAAPASASPERGRSRAFSSGQPTPPSPTTDSASAAQSQSGTDGDQIGPRSRLRR